MIKAKNPSINHPKVKQMLKEKKKLKLDLTDTDILNLLTPGK